MGGAVTLRQPLRMQARKSQQAVLAVSFQKLRQRTERNPLQSKGIVAHQFPKIHAIFKTGR